MNRFHNALYKTVRGSNNPAFFDIVEAHGKQADTECTENYQVKNKWHNVPTMHGPMQYVSSVSQGQHVRKGFQKYRQLLNGKK